MFVIVFTPISSAQFLVSIEISTSTPTPNATGTTNEKTDEATVSIAESCPVLIPVSIGESTGKGQ
jgi:hypothetical protein